MGKILRSSSLYSHPEKPLENHLIKVGELASDIIIEAPLEPILEISKDTIARMAKITGLSHDIGKATNFFQTYLISQDNKLRADPRTHHSYLSSIIGFMEAKALGNLLHLDKSTIDLLAFHVYWVVKRHHSNLEDLEIELNDREDLNILYEQIDSIDEQKLVVLSDILKQVGLPLPLCKKMLSEWIDSFYEEIKSIKKAQRKIQKRTGLERYLLQNLLFSSLIDADKMEVTIEDKPKRNPIDLKRDLVDKYKDRKFANNPSNIIDILREKSYEEILKREPDLSQRIVSINLPTGLGKTLTAFAYALKLREKIFNNKNIQPRIIYSLPFLSVIEQNLEVIKNVLESNNINLDNSILLEHHHLSEAKYNIKKDELDIESSKILIEGWNSEIVITTFMQLFETIFSNRNSALRRFNKLSGSIIILDEIQAIPVKYWELLNVTLRTLLEKFNSYIILLTATEPLIFEESAIHKLTESKKYFKEMNRTVITSNINEEKSIEEFVNNLELENNKRYLFIFNTIKCAKKFYFELQKISPKGEKLIFLSSHITPYERLLRIKRLNEENIRFAVTTQLVEAGVDIDFDFIYRDIAPFDSIIQAAGRCNRNWRNKNGEVKVVSLRDDKGLYSTYVYDGFLLDVTKSILKKHPVIEESELFEIINEYYHLLKNKISLEISVNIIEAIEKLKYADAVDGKTSISDFRLIENETNKIDVFVEINEKAKKVWDEFCKIMEIKNMFHRRNEFEKIKKDLYSFVIAVPADSQGLPPINNGFGYINLDCLSDYYDEVTGFKPNENFIW